MKTLSVNDPDVGQPSERFRCAEIEKLALEQIAKRLLGANPGAHLLKRAAL